MPVDEIWKMQSQWRPAVVIGFGFLMVVIAGAMLVGLIKGQAPKIVIWGMLPVCIGMAVGGTLMAVVEGGKQAGNVIVGSRSLEKQEWFGLTSIVVRYDTVKSMGVSCLNEDGSRCRITFTLRDGRTAIIDDAQVGPDSLRPLYQRLAELLRPYDVKMD